MWQKKKDETGCVLRNNQFNMSWIQGVLIAIDQLGNAIAGGNPDATISARVGYFANEVDSHFKYYWKTMELIIDCAFLPIDGPKHCHNEYLKDKDHHNEAGSDLIRAILGLIIIVFCVPIAVITRIYVLVFEEAKFSNEWYLISFKISLLGTIESNGETSQDKPYLCYRWFLKEKIKLDKKHYPTAFLLVIAFALYFMYGDMFSLKNVNFQAYKEACVKMQSAKAGTYTNDEIQSLVNKINYLLPGTVAEIQEPLKKEIKNCANELSKSLSH